MIIFNFEAARGLLFSSYTRVQVDNINLIMREINTQGIDNAQQAAYVLATVYHETAKTMQPIEEYGHGRGRPYYKRVGKFMQRYFGRGFVQLTWYRNYKLFERLLGIPLLKQPNLATTPKYAAKILVLGMKKGLFTGKSLADYTDNNGDCDFIKCRRIINGTDRAALVADYANRFLTCLHRECQP